MRITVLLCCFLITSSVAAKTQLNIWHMLQDMDTDFTATALAFSRQQADIDVSVHLLPNEELKASAIRAANQQQAPDIIIISSDNVGYANLMRLSELPAEFIEPDMPVPVRQALQFRQKDYSLPLFAGNHLLMMYNKALVKTPITDWQQLFRQQAEFARQGVKTLALNYQEPYWFALFASLFGATLTAQDSVTLNSIAMQNALTFYQQLADSGVAQSGCGYHCVTEDFYQGNYAYAVNGSWAVAAAKQRLGDNLGIILFPQWQQSKVQPLASYIVMIFPNQSLYGEKAAQIKKFIRYFRQRQHLQALAEKHYLTPYFMADRAGPQADAPLYREIQAQTRLSWLMPASEAMVSVWNGMQKGMLLHQNNTLDAAAAVDFMQKVAQRDQQLLENGP